MAINSNKYQPNNEEALNLIRAKIDRIFSGEPSVKEELQDTQNLPEPLLSKHQEFILKLKNSNEPLATIQIAWHKYYNGLSNSEKIEVWQEFYASKNPSDFLNATKKITQTIKPETLQSTTKEKENQDIITNQNGVIVSKHTIYEPRPIARRARRPKLSKQTNLEKANTIRNSIRSKIVREEHFEKLNLRAKHNLQSLAFGLATGFVVILIFMFSFFNERFLAPFIHPSYASATPIILSPDAISPTDQPEIIIPKINLQIPLVLNIQSTNENVIENALENGVIHYPTTVLPGQLGNVAFFGHSSNNIFSPGKYKFAFVLLGKLQAGDIFYITYNQKVYVYKVYDKQIVAPSDVQVLNDVPGKPATATLITCDPPGTSINRLVVWGEQISPNPIDNSTSSASVTSPPSTQSPQIIAGNGPSLLSRLWPF